MSDKNTKNTLEIQDKKEEKTELTNAEKKELKQEAKEIIKKQEEQSKNKNVSEIKQILTKEEKVANFFDSIEFLSMENDQKELVALKVKSDSL